MDDKEQVGRELYANVVRLFPGRDWSAVGPLDVALAVLDRLDRLSGQIDRLAELMSPTVMRGGALTPDQMREISQPGHIIPEPPPAPPRPVRPILVPGHPFPEDR